MSKEVKVGLAVLSTLFVAFGYSVYDRFLQPRAVAQASPVNIQSPSEAQHGHQHRIAGADAPKSQATPAAAWVDAEEESAEKPSTFRAVEKPVLVVAESGTSTRSTLPSETKQAAADPFGAADSAFQGAPVPVPTPQPTDVQPVAAESSPGQSYQPPRVLAEADVAQQSPQPYQQAPTQQSYAPPLPQQAPVQQSPAQRDIQQSYAPPAGQPSYAQSPAQAAPAPSTVPTDYRQTSRPAARSNRGTYRVGPNDTFWTISKKTYGSGAYFKALASHNSTEFPSADRLAVGDVVETPSTQELMQDYPELCPKLRGAASGNRFSSVSDSTRNVSTRPYEVQKGDTLFDIARFELGDGSRWIEIYELNQRQLTQDFDYIKPGMKILLPTRTKQWPAESVAEGQDGRTRR